MAPITMGIVCRSARNRGLPRYCPSGINGFREVSHADVAICVTTSTVSGHGNGSARGDSTSMATSLNRTTWDMLDGKWLGF